jgi:hypothetical protein
MRAPPLFLLIVTMASPVAAQVRVDLLYGFERNVESPGAEYDGWLGAIVEWEVRPGLSIGVGSDHQFENARPSAGDYQSTAIFATISRTFGGGAVAPHVRVGLGLGPAPCQGDTCHDGLYLRGAVGVSGHVSGPVSLVAEVGLSRVGRPFGGAGLSYRLGS